MDRIRIVVSRFRLVIAALLLLLLLAACGGSSAPAEESAVEPAAESAEPAADTVEDAAPVDEAEDEEADEPAAADEPAPIMPDPATAGFSNPTNIDNQWLPMQPGTQWVVEGISVEEGEEIPHRIEFTVTDLTKEIDGVQTVVAWIVDISDGEVVEKELAFYAQDDDGNVWYFGEHPEEFEDGEFVAAPTWLSGIADAQAGIKMWDNPEMGTSAYFQGWGPEVEWTDYGQIDEVAAETCVALDCYENVLIIAESSLDESGAFQLKYYATGVGNVQVGWKGDDTAYEELELVAWNQLDEAALAAIREEALALEAHAYEVSEVYSQTSPAQGP